MNFKIIKINNAKLKVKLAVTEKQMAKGLMNVTEMPENEGMLFCYPEERKLTFWMKSTPIPLSIAFIDKDKKIIQIEDLEPYDETSVQSDRAAKWALESNQGWFDQNNISVGDKIKFLGNKLIKVKVVKT
tara:strand:+ start:35 stop:424 length:390 start_codon:yes stop_codon:yes gene_type:complete